MKLPLEGKWHWMLLILARMQSRSFGLNKLLRCESFGKVAAKCQDKCLAGNKCLQETIIEKCSCQGYQSHLRETAVYGNDGELKSSGGFGFLSRCSPCSDYCLNATEIESARLVQMPMERSYAADHGANTGEEGAVTLANDICEEGRIGGMSDHEDMDIIDQNGMRTPQEVGDCPDAGNLTRLCTEKCSVDGRTCSTQVDVVACTCGNIRIKMHEIVVYDMDTKSMVLEGSPMSQSGYSRVCGDCTEFCAWMPGEVKEYFVNSYITTCEKQKMAGEPRGGGVLL